MRDFLRRIALNLLKFLKKKFYLFKKLIIFNRKEKNNNKLRNV